MALKNFHKTLAETPGEIDTFVENSMNILERIHELLDEKFDGKQKLLADKLGKSEAEISKWINGVQNFTLKTISKLEAAFGEKILAVYTNHTHGEFMQIKAPPEKGYIQVKVSQHGFSEEKFVSCVVQTNSEILPGFISPAS